MPGGRQATKFIMYDDYNMQYNLGEAGTMIPPSAWDGSELPLPDGTGSSSDCGCGCGGGGGCGSMVPAKYKKWLCYGLLALALVVLIANFKTIFK